MSYTISVVNQKGGVGKTVTSVNLSAGLAKRGYRVLAVDGDMQANLTLNFGYDGDELEETLAEALLSDLKDEDYDLSKCIISTDEGVDLIPASIDLAEVEDIFSTVHFEAENRFSNMLNPIKEQYDFIIIDCPPAVNKVSENLLYASDAVLIPSEAATFSVKGMNYLFRRISKIKKYKLRRNTSITILGVLFTRVRGNLNISRTYIDQVGEWYGDYINVFKTTIPELVEASEAVSNAESIFKYAPDGKVAAAYNKIIDEIIGERKV